MTEENIQWIRDNQDRLQRIRVRFIQYQQERNQSARLSGSSQGRVEHTQGKLQNQWRKVNDLLRKEIPLRLDRHPLDSRQLNYLKNEANNIEKMVKKKFGQDKLQQLKFKDNCQVWKTPVMSSGFRKELPPEEEKKLREESIIMQEDEGREKEPSQVSKIFKKYQQIDDQSINRIEKGERRSKEHVAEVIKAKKLDKSWNSFMLKFIILLSVVIILIVYLKVPIGLDIVRLLQL